MRSDGLPLSIVHQNIANSTSQKQAVSSKKFAIIFGTKNAKLIRLCPESAHQTMGALVWGAMLVLASVQVVCENGVLFVYFEVWILLSFLDYCLIQLGPRATRGRSVRSSLEWQDEFRSDWYLEISV